MFKFYRSIKLSTRIVVLGSILLLTAAGSFQYGYSFPIVAAVIVGLALLLHVAATKARVLLATFVIVTQILVVGLSGEVIKGVYTQIGYDGNLAGLTFQSLALLSIAVLSTIAYRYIPGRLWATLLVAFILYDIAYLSLLAFTGFIASVLIGFGIALAFFAARALIKRKSKPFVLPKRNSKEINKTETLLKEKMIFVEKQDLPYVDFFALSKEKNKFYAVFTLDVKNHLKTQSNELIVDGQSITPLLELVISNSKKLAKTKKIKTYNVIPIILIHSALPSKRYVIKVNSRRKPDLSLGSVIIATVAGFDKTLDSYSTLKPLKTKQLASTI